MQEPQLGQSFALALLPDLLQLQEQRWKQRVQQRVQQQAQEQKQEQEPVYLAVRSA